MQNYLEPVDDGLPMRDSGPWAAHKLDYLKRYIEIFEKSMRNKWHKRHYVDLFAGPGKCRTDNGAILLGSPLLALTTPYPFTDYVFAELDTQGLDTLRTRSSAYSNFSSIQFKNGDSNTTVHDIVTTIRASDRKEASLNLAFLDPQGLELQWSTLEALASIERMDLIIHYPVMGLKRSLGAASRQDHHAIDLFFGDSKWRDAYAKAKDASIVEQDLLKHYKKKLESLGYVEVVQNEATAADPAMKNTKQGLLYRLLFASKHRLGDKFWKDVTRRDAHGQRRLF